MQPNASAKCWWWKMLDCRYYDLCCFTDDSCNGEQECPKREHCQFYKPMPDVKTLLELADEMTVEKGDIWRWSSRIRDALGVEHG